MSVGLQVWSQTASNNSTIDTNINWPEGMAPSQVDDSARAVMASMAKWRDDNNGSIVTGGTTIAFTATTSQVEAALTAGYTIAIQFNATADTSATLAVDSLAAKPLQIVAGTNLQGGEFTAGDICRFTYSSTGTGQWIAQGPQAYLQNASQVATNLLPYSKIQQVGASKLLGNATGGSANIEEITLGSNLAFSGTTLNASNTAPQFTIVTSTTSSTFVVPTNGSGQAALYLRVRMVAGGGGGASNGSNGSNGANSQFENWTAVKGSGGITGGAGGAGGTSGSSGTGTLIRRITGQAGEQEAGSGDTSAGGSSVFGGGGPANNGTGIGAVANTGSGGSGAGNSGGGGGAGEFVEFMITPLSTSTTYGYFVGNGGAAGGASGGAGATGRLEIEAYWQ